MNPWQATWGRAIRNLTLIAGISLALIPALSSAQSVSVVTRTTILGGGSKLAAALGTVKPGAPSALLEQLRAHGVWNDPDVVTLLETAKAGNLDPFAAELAGLDPALVPLIQHVSQLSGESLPGAALSVVLAGNSNALARLCATDTALPAVVTSVSEAASRAAWMPQASNPLLSEGRGVPKNQIVVILGASGDLTKRLVMPAYLNLAHEARMPESSAIVGFSNAEWSDDAFRGEMADAMTEFGQHQPSGAVWDDFQSRLHYEYGDLTSPERWRAFGQRLDRLHAELGTNGNTIYHFAIPPGIIGPVTNAMTEAGVVNLDGTGPFTRVVIEKPFGHDLASSNELRETVHPLAASGQLFRIDHYLGRESVQLLLQLRSEGTVEAALNAKYVTRVEVNGMESIGIEGRGAYFEQSGIMRDMVQSHLIQLTALAMANFEGVTQGGQVVQRKISWLRRLDRDNARVVRAQYTASADGSIPNYLAEEGVPDGSTNETLIAMELRHKGSRWNDVPIYIRSGKALGEKRNDITYHLRSLPPALAEELGIDANQPAALRWHVDPDPKVVLYTADKEITLAVPGAAEAPTSYQRLISEYLHGECGLFVSCAEVTASWRLFDPMLQDWASAAPGSLPTYQAGTTGPQEVQDLLPAGFGSERPVVGKR